MKYYRQGALPAALLLCLLAAQPAAAQRRQGYRISDTHIAVDSPDHWRNWQLPTHAVDLTADGRVQPHRFQNRYNLLDDLRPFTRNLPGFERKKNETAILNVDSTETRDVRGNIITEKKKGQEVPLYTYFLRPGISRVGSNPEDAAAILDGDPSTYWEPDPRDPIDEWWVEVDLGRVVPVDEIVLHFVDPELGDPFRQFRVLAAPDQRPILQEADKIGFVAVGGTQAPNQDQREFRFPLRQLLADPNWTGKLVETFRIVVTATRAGRGAQVTQDEWLALDPADRGEILYFIRDQQGFEELVSREVYESLPSERQGRKDYYRRERPRLADIEVWGFGDNISPGLVEGGGSLFLTGGNFSPGPGFDGDFTTNFLHLVWSPTIDRGVLTVDLGATFWLDAMRVSSSQPRPFIDGYIIRSSDGSRDASGQLRWRRLSPRAREDNSVDQFENLLDTYDPAPRLRFLEMTIVSVDPRRRGGYNTGPNIAEYQLFSRGYPAEVVLTSDLIELPGARTLGRITWEAEPPPGTNLEIRTRTGDLLARIIRYFDKSGTEITYEAWKNLLGSFKGPVDTTFVPTSGWSAWSRVYQHPGDQVTSPGLRKYMQIQVEMTTADRDTAAAIRSVAVELLEPVAGRILAELWPVEISAPGQVDTFEVLLRPEFIERPLDSRSAGFDELLLAMPAAQGMELLELALDIDPQSGRAGQVFRPAGGAFADEQGKTLRVLENRADSIWVRLPAALNILPGTARVYNRITAEGEQVPVSQDGLPLTGPSYGLLADEEKGAIRYFRQSADGALAEVDQLTYQALAPQEQGPIRYFRILRGDGAQFPFDPDGDSLSADAYGRLPSSTKGMVVGPGPLVRLRFRAPVFLNGTTLQLAVRNTAGGADAPWQGVEPGDAAPLLPGNTLSISVPFAGQVIGDFRISPNPFTPNGDNINDEAEIGFSVFKITASRQVRVRVYTLDGRAVWEKVQVIQSGPATIRWPGTDDQGRKVPPGLYICQVEVDADAARGAQRHSRLVAVVY